MAFTAAEKQRAKDYQSMQDQRASPSDKTKPDPQPTYTTQTYTAPSGPTAAEIAAAERNRQASLYNTNVGNYNTALTGYQTQYNDLSRRIGGLSLGSFYDNPNTQANENPYDSLRLSLSGLKTGLGGLSIGMERPDFTGVAGAPGLTAANSDLYNILMSGLGEIGGTLDTGYKARQAEEARVRGFSTGMLGSLAPLQSQVGNLTIADLSRINDIDGQLAALKAQRQGFSSSIYDQVIPNGPSALDTQFNTIGSSVSNLRAQRSAEEKRIKDFEASLYAGADGINGRIGGMTIADMDGMKAVRSELEALMTGAGRFDSMLNFDLSQETGAAGLGGSRLKLDQLFADRSAEEQRVATAEQDFRNRGYNLEDLANGLSPYNVGNLELVQRRATGLRNDVSKFSSALPFNFNDGDLEGLDAASTRLEKMVADRAAQLSELGGRVGTPLAGIADIALSDEAGMNARRNSMQDLLNEVNMYTGDDADRLRTQLTGGVNAVDSRLKELGTYRTNLETQAQQLMKRVQDASYYSSAGLTKDQAALEQMRDQVKLYNAQQAMDELSTIEQRILGERSRLVEDEGVVAKRESAAQAAVYASLGAGGVPQFGNQSANPALQALYGRYLYNRPEEEALLAPTSAGAFSSALSFGG